VEELLRFHFKEVTFDSIAFYLRCYVVRLLFYVVSHSLALVML
jgi:hypothetical protein